MKKIFVFLIALLLVSILEGEIIQLKDGTKIQGKIIKQDEQKVEIQDEKGIIQIISKEKIEKILPDIPLTPSYSFSVDQKRVRKAGEYLKKYTIYHYTSLGFTTLGATFLFSELIYQYQYKESSPMGVIGMGFCLSSVIMELVSHYFIYQAGKNLEEAIK